MIHAKSLVALMALAVAGVGVARLALPDTPEDRVRRHATAVVTNPAWARDQIEASLADCVRYSAEAPPAVREAVRDLVGIVVFAYAAGDEPHEMTVRANEAAEAARRRLSQQEADQALVYLRSVQDDDVSACFYDRLEERLRGAT